MKVIIYLFILSQLLNLLSVFADKVKKDSQKKRREIQFQDLSNTL